MHGKRLSFNFIPSKAIKPTTKTTDMKTTIENFEVEAALRNYERAHKIYMTTSVFSSDAVRVKEELNRARDLYTLAVKKNNPNWIVC